MLGCVWGLLNRVVVIPRVEWGSPFLTPVVTADEKRNRSTGSRFSALPVVGLRWRNMEMEDIFQFTSIYIWATEKLQNLDSVCKSTHRAAGEKIRLKQRTPTWTRVCNCNSLMSRVNRCENSDQSYRKPRCARNRSEQFLLTSWRRKIPRKIPHMMAQMLKKGNDNTGALASSFGAESR